MANDSPDSPKPAPSANAPQPTRSADPVRVAALLLFGGAVLFLVIIFLQYLFSAARDGICGVVGVLLAGLLIFARLYTIIAKKFR